PTGLPGFIAPLGNHGRHGRDHAPDRPEYAFDHVTPVRIHIQRETATSVALVVPAWPLAGTFVAVEHPPAEFELEASDAPEEIVRGQALQLVQAGQVNLVLDRSGLEPVGFDIAQ